MNIRRRIVLPSSLAFLILLTFLPNLAVYAASTCAGFIPATINTPALLITAVQQAQSGNCPGADTIDLAGNTITFTTSGFTDSGENLALPAITTPLTITNGTITRSSATGFKFLLIDTGGNLTLSNMILSNGGGTGIGIGGAIHVGNGNLTVTSTTFLNNSAPGYGGGAIFGNGSAFVSISDSLFQWNQSGTMGGAVHLQSSGNLTVSRTEFFGNVAGNGSGNGAAITLENSGTSVIQDSLFAGNYSYASALFVQTGSDNISFINNSVAGNARSAISAITTTNSTFRNNLIWGNGSSFNGTVPTVTYTAAEGYAGATINSGYTVEDFFVNPLTNPTAANTGLNYNPALYDWTLRPFSPAIDAADNTYATTFDINSTTRRVDDTNVTNTGAGASPIVDMGAYERQLSSCSAFTFPYTLAGATNAIRRQNLRDAIRCANLNGTADTIDLNGQTVTYDVAFATYQGAGTALPLISTPVTIQNGIIERSTAGGTPDFRLFYNAAGGTLTLNTITLRNGSAGTANGGAISNFASLVIEQSTLSNNSGAQGGAISSNTATNTTINRSTLSSNSASVLGTAIGITGTGTLSISNSTVTGNTATGTGYGAVVVASPGQTIAANVTISDNTSGSALLPGGLASYGTLYLYNSILANNGSGDCLAGGTRNFSAGTSNIIEVNNASNPCGTAGVTHLTVDPQLGTLTGSPAYYPLASASSPAVNAGDNASIGGATVDQPGNTRIQQTTVDLGSYESPFASQTRTIAFANATSNAPEAAGLGNLLLVTTSDGAATQAAITVTVNVTGGTAAAADYNLTGTITIPAGTANNALVSIASGITVTNETLVEPNETLQLTLSAPAGAVLGAQSTTTHTINNDDTTTVTIADVTQAEGNAGTSTMTFTVTVDNAVQGGFTLDYTTTDLFATTADNDYVAATGILTFAGTANESHTIVVTINGDTKVEQNETFRVSFPTAGSTAAPGSIIITDTAIGTITNDDTAALTIADMNLIEGNAGTSTMTFTVTLNNAAQGGFTVNYATANGTATTADNDYVPTTGTLAFTGTAGETQTFTVTINGDTKVESDETFTVSMNTVSNTAVTITDTAIGTITDDDTASLTIADVALTEGNAGTANMIFTVTLDNAVPGGFTVNYATANGTATIADNDYMATTGTLAFAGTAGETQTFIVLINGDTKVEADETFTVSLNTVSNPAIDITDTATGTINNNDNAAVTIANVTQAENGVFTFTATLSNATSDPFSVDWGLAAGTTNAADYVGGVLPTGGTLAFVGTAGETRTFTVPVVDDALVEPTETFTVSMANFVTIGGFTIDITDTATGTITDNDTASLTIADVALTEGNAGTSTMTFTATLNNAVQGGFTVNYATANGTATTADNDYVAATGTLTFAGTAGETQTFTVTINGDTVFEPDETFTVSLNTVSNAAVNIADTAVGIINNDDGATLTIADAAINEGNAGTSTVTFTVTLSNAVPGGFTVNYATANGTATTADNDYVAATGILTFAGIAGETQTFTVPINGDAKAEANETFTVSLNTVSNAAINITDIAVGTITNDDIAAYVVDTTATAASIAEPTGSTTFTIWLGSLPAGTVILDFGSTDLTECSVTPTSFTFNAGNWNAAQTITITVVDDSIADGTQPCAAAITRNAGSTAVEYAPIANPANVALNVTDNDTAGITLSTITVTEGAAGVNMDVGLSTEPTGDVTITLTPDAQCTLSTNTLTFTNSAGATPWNIAQQVTVTAVDDAFVEGAHTCVITYSAASSDLNYTVAATNHTLNVVDNDTSGIFLAPITVSEGGVGVNMDVRLLTQPTGNVTITLIPDSQCTLNPITLTFTDSAGVAPWSVAQQVTVAAVDDLLVEANPHNCVVSVSATSTDGSYNGLTLTHSVTVLDNDSTAIGGTPTSPVVPAIPAATFLCSNLSEQTNRAMTGSGDISNVELNGIYGNTYCTVIALNSEFLRNPAEIGNTFILEQGVVQALDVYGLLPDGVSVVAFQRPVEICLAGSGSVYFLSSFVGSPPPVQLPLLPNSPTGYNCVSVPNAGKVVLVGTASSLPPTQAPSNATSTLLVQGACQVTTTFAVRLRTTPDTSANVIAMLPFDLRLVATEYVPGWYRVIYLDGQGWVSEKYLKARGNC